MNLVAVYPNPELAREAVERLQRQGITWDSIGLAVRMPEESSAPPDSATADEAAEDTADGRSKTKAALVGAVSGAGLGGLLGMSLVGTTVRVPGIGPVMISGPLAALLGAGLGLASGGLLGTLVGSGIPEHEAPDYLKRIQEGQVLLTVDVDSDRAARARQALEPAGARG
jgi:hypothetical protein